MGNGVIKNSDALFHSIINGHLLDCGFTQIRYAKKSIQMRFVGKEK